jgi:hypothetical protein
LGQDSVWSVFESTIRRDEGAKELYHRKENAKRSLTKEKLI